MNWTRILLAVISIAIIAAYIFVVDGREKNLKKEIEELEKRILKLEQNRALF